SAGRGGARESRSPAATSASHRRKSKGPRSGRALRSWEIRRTDRHELTGARNLRSPNRRPVPAQPCAARPINAAFGRFLRFMFDDRSTPRRTRLRYFVLAILLLALAGGWTWFWRYAAARAEVAVEGWRAREASAGRVYSCGSQSMGGFPFRIEVNC